MPPVLTALSLLAGCVPHLESPDGGVPQDWLRPANSWATAEPPAGLLGEGWFEGDVVQPLPAAGVAAARTR